MHFLIEMDANESSRFTSEFRALCRKLKFMLKAFVAAHYESMKFEMIFNILPYSPFLFFFIPLPFFLTYKSKADIELEQHFPSLPSMLQ